MAQENIEIQVQANTGQAQTNINNLDRVISELTNDIKSLSQTMISNVGASNQMSADLSKVSTNLEQMSSILAQNIASINALGGSITNLEQSMGKLKKSVEDNTVGLSQIKSGLSLVGGELGNATSGALVFGEQLLVLAENPVVLTIMVIVAALELFKEAATDSVGGADDFSASMSDIQFMGKEMVQGVIDFAKSLTQWNMSQEEYNKMADELAGGTAKQRQAMYDLDKTLSQNRRNKDQFIISEKEANAELVKSRDIMTDNTASIEERTQALSHIRSIEEKLAGDRKTISAIDMEAAVKVAKVWGFTGKTLEDVNAALNDRNTKGKQLIASLKLLQSAYGDEADALKAEEEVKVKINRLQKRLDAETLADKKKRLDQEKKWRAEEKKRIENELKDLIAKHQAKINADVEGSQQELDDKKKLAEAEIKFYDKHYKDLGISYAVYQEKISKLKKEELKEDKVFNKQKIKNDTELLVAQDELSIIAETDKDEKLKLEKKKEKDQLEGSLKQLQLNQDQINLIYTEEGRKQLKDKGILTGDMLKLYAEYITKIQSLDDKDIKSKEEAEKKKRDLKIKEEEYNVKTLDEKRKQLEKLGIINKETLDAAINAANDERTAKVQLENDKFQIELEAAKKSGETQEEIQLRTKEHYDRLMNIQGEYSAEVVNDNKELEKNHEQMYNAIDQSITNFEGLMAQHSDLAKATAIAQSIWHTYGAATKVLDQEPNPGPQVVIPEMIAVITAGLANVAKITAVGNPAGGGGSNVSTTMPSAPSMFALGQGQIQNPSQFASNRVYVTENDITSTQQRVKTVESASILGG